MALKVSLFYGLAGLVVCLAIFFLIDYLKRRVFMSSRAKSTSTGRRTKRRTFKRYC